MALISAPQPPRQEPYAFPVPVILMLHIQPPGQERHNFLVPVIPALLTLETALPGLGNSWRRVDSPKAKPFTAAQRPAPYGSYTPGHLPPARFTPHLGSSRETALCPEPTGIFQPQAPPCLAFPQQHRTTRVLPVSSGPWLTWALPLVAPGGPPSKELWVTNYLLQWWAPPALLASTKPLWTAAGHTSAGEGRTPHLLVSREQQALLTSQGRHPSEGPAKTPPEDGTSPAGLGWPVPDSHTPCLPPAL